MKATKHFVPPSIPSVMAAGPQSAAATCPTEEDLFLPLPLRPHHLMQLMLC